MNSFHKLYLITSSILFLFSIGTLIPSFLIYNISHSEISVSKGKYNTTNNYITCSNDFHNFSFYFGIAFSTNILFLLFLMIILNVKNCCYCINFIKEIPFWIIVFTLEITLFIMGIIFGDHLLFYTDCKLSLPFCWNMLCVIFSLCLVEFAISISVWVALIFCKD